MRNVSVKQLQQQALRVRQLSLAMGISGSGAHLAPAYSITELLTVLFYGFLRDGIPEESKTARDHFVLSKGHGCAALYAILALKGKIAREEVKRYTKPDGILGGHPDRNLVPGVEASTGSLGHGLTMATGMALGLRMRKSNSHVFCLIGDGETQEGSIWESLLFAGNQRLENLTIILDYNRLQGMGEVEKISSLEPLRSKLEAFNFRVSEIDGHDIPQIINAFNLSADLGRPHFVIANTVKGKGLSFMEGKTIWHYKIPKGEQTAFACRELGVDVSSGRDAVDELISVALGESEGHHAQ